MFLNKGGSPGKNKENNVARYSYTLSSLRFSVKAESYIDRVMTMKDYDSGESIIFHVDLKKNKCHCNKIIVTLFVLIVYHLLVL